MQERDSQHSFLSELTESKCRFILDSLQAGIVIIEPGTHIIVDANPAALQLIGAAKEEIAGHICHSFICPADVGKCPITDLKQKVDKSERVLLTFTGKKIPILKTVSLIELDGHQLILENFIDITDRKNAEEEIRKHRGHLEELVKARTEELDKANRELQTEIVERRQVEQELQRSRERFSQVAENADEWIWEVDKEGLFTYSSSAIEAILGYSPEELIGKIHFYDFFAPDVREDLKQASFQAFEQRESFKDFVNLNIHKNGKTVLMKTSGTPVTDREGNLLGYCGADVDITREKQAEEQIKAALKEKEVLLKEVHHRVKNNLQIVSSMLTLQASQADDPKILEFCEESRYRIKSMALIHESLYCSEDLASIDLGRHMHSIISSFIKSHEEKACNINFSLKADTVLLSIEKAVPCGLIVNELVSNVFKHGFSGHKQGDLTVELSCPDGNKAKMIIRNNGNSFPQDIDFRESPSLGLQLVKELVDQIEGSIEFSRENGTTFTITFPL